MTRELTDEEVFGAPAQPRGIRNNNPLNMKPGGQFAVYPSMEEGWQAADRNLQAYGSKHGINTVAGVVNRWAPAADRNNPQAYAQFVAQRAGIAPDQPIDLANPQTRQALLGPMAEFENGRPVPRPGPQRELSDEEVFGAPQQGAPPPAQAGPARAPPAAAAPRSAPQAPPKPNRLADFSESLISHVPVGAAGLVDAALNFTPAGGAMRALSGGNPLGLPTLTKPTGDVVSRMTSARAHKPETVEGEYGRTIGLNAPNLLFPGSVPARIANMLLPALASETAGQVARKSGADPSMEHIARALGALGGGGVASVRASRSAAPPSVADLQALKTEAYGKVDASGFKFPQADITALAKQVKAAVEDAGGAELNEQAVKMARRIQRVAGRGDLPLPQLDKLRAQVGEKVIAKGEPTLGYQIRDMLDGLIDSAHVPEMREARAANAQFKKLEAVQTAIDSAALSPNGSGANINAVGRKLKPLIDPASSSRIKNLTPEETKAIARVVNSPPQVKAARALSAFDPFSGKVSQLLQAGAAFGTGGHSLVAAPLGLAARFAAEKMTKADLAKVAEVIGKDAARPKAQTPGGAVPLTATDRAALIGLATLLGRPEERPQVPQARQRSR